MGCLRKMSKDPVNKDIPARLGEGLQNSMEDVLLLSQEEWSSGNLLQRMSHHAQACPIGTAHLPSESPPLVSLFSI